MARPRSEYPTELELQILKVLWNEAAMSVQQVREALAKTPFSRQLTHSSVITVLNIMVRKRYLKRTERSRAFYFQPVMTEQQVNRGMLGDLVDRVFDGSAKSVMLELLETSDLDPDELREIRRIINRRAKEQSS